MWLVNQPLVGHNLFSTLDFHKLLLSILYLIHLKDLFFGQKKKKKKKEKSKSHADIYMYLINFGKSSCFSLRQSWLMIVVLTKHIENS